MQSTNSSNFSSNKINVKMIFIFFMTNNKYIEENKLSVFFYYTVYNSHFIPKMGNWKSL